MFEKISREKAKKLIDMGCYKDLLNELELDSSDPPWVQENAKINCVRIVHAYIYSIKYPGREYPDETVHSSVVIEPKVSSDAIINDANKETGITATEATIVTKPASDEEKIILKSSATCIADTEVVISAANVDANLLSNNEESSVDVSNNREPVNVKQLISFFNNINDSIHHEKTKDTTSIVKSENYNDSSPEKSSFVDGYNTSDIYDKVDYVGDISLDTSVLPLL
ncbi:hypothetical protein [Candidatus Tisiphia endosymbiont of Oplodontha viridula]|uniref:hypothetical protein n=1 Tax=Candidatus Tisiphia endosymbiont of Oplodontha viridula TaxID=3077925 RepID=UPI0035C88AD5